MSIPESTGRKPGLEIEEVSMDSLFNEHEDFSAKLYDGEIVSVKVVEVTKDHVLVNIGEKKEGLIAVSEFDGGRNIPSVGSEIAAVLVKKGKAERNSILSYRRAIEKKGLEQCRNAKESKQRINGIVSQLIKGGYVVEVFGIRGFMPLSLSEMYPTHKHNLPRNAKIRCQITEFSISKRKVIVSRKQVLMEDEQKRREKVFSDLKVGDTVRVLVSNVSKDKILLRYQGVEAYVKVDNVSWYDPKNAIKMFKRGTRLRGKVLFVDREKYILEIGLKQIFPNPADVLRKNYPPRSVVKGKVTKITADGGYVSLSSRTSGFIPSGEFGKELQLKEGENILSVVTGIDAKNFTLKLSVRRFEILQNKRIVAKYLKKPPRLTLGQLLSKEEKENSEESMQ